jgi:H+-transporting ATPase
VSGDLVRIRSGEIVPADLDLGDGESLEIDESALTGESLPVEKGRGDKAFSGSIVRRGEMNATVVATGMDTFFGKTARLVEEAEPESHFQKAVVKIGDYLILLAIGLVILIFLTALYRHESVLDTLRFALVLTVAAIPAALPAVLSVTMVVGASALARRKAIVSRLVAIEEMAGMDVLCTDKTGTITQNKLAVTQVLPHGDASEEDVLLYGWLASREENEDPIDDAVIRAARSRPGLGEEAAAYRMLEFRPFDPVAKRTEAVVETPRGETLRLLKGAPQVILKLTDPSAGERAGVEAQVGELASAGFRALAVAGDRGSGPPILVGLLALMDPPREDSADTIQDALDLGVNVKMVTGDHAAIARQIATQVHLGNQIREVSSFLDRPDREAGRAVEEADGFAQVFPEHKYHIVDVLQQRGHIVGMTGDGVNDAPALKEADAGIAVAGATDAARAAADIILTDPGLSVITDAITQSRRVFSRMNSYAVYRITETIRVLFFITLSILVFNFYPVTALMIVLLALLNDAPIMAIAYDNADFSRKPVRWNMRTVLGISTLLGLVGVASSFGMFYIGRDVLHLSRETIQSLVFLKLAVAGHLTIFLTRTRGPFWSNRPSAPLLLSAIATKLLATLVVAYGWLVAPLGWRLTGYVWLYALTAFVITDLVKVQFYRLLDHGAIQFSR